MECTSTHTGMHPVAGDKWDGVFPGIRMKWAVDISGMHDGAQDRVN